LGHKKAAFTLIEMLGVLGILAILASMLLPSVIRQVNRANATKEATNLGTLADAMTRSVLRTKAIPLAANIPAALATEANLGLIQIISNSVGAVRAFMIDTNATLTRSGGSGVPYSQTTTTFLTAPPGSIRAMFISSLSRANPLTSSETNFSN